MKIAYNPTGGSALNNVDSTNKDIIFDLSGMAIYARGTLVGKVYQTFEKSTSTTDGYNGLVPFPDYNNDSKTRFLREDGTWNYPNWTDILNKPITLAGYGIEDEVWFLSSPVIVLPELGQTVSTENIERIIKIQSTKPNPFSIVYQGIIYKGIHIENPSGSLSGPYFIYFDDIFTLNSGVQYPRAY